MNFFFTPLAPSEPLLSKFFQTTLILAIEANSALSRENETKIVKITHSGSGCDIVMLLAARFSICNVFTVQHIFGTFVKGALNCNFLGSQSVKNNYKKYASSNIFKSILFIYIREVIFNFQKAFI